MHPTAMTPALEEDRLARKRALEPASFLVQAPAGSGKTELLTQRFLALLARVDHPEEVVALTFTNKAASEMRSRIVASLAMAAAGARPGDALPHRQTTYDLAGAVLARDRERGWDLAGHRGRLNVLTIDALCGNLVRQMPYLSGFGHQPRVEPDALGYYRAAAMATLALAEGDEPQAQCVRSALRYFQNDTAALGGLLADMLAGRDGWQRLGAEAPDAQVRARTALEALLSRFLRAAAGVLDAHTQERIMPAARFAAATNGTLAALGDWNAVLAGEPGELEQWQALASLLLTKSGAPRRSLRAPDGFPAGQIQAAALRDGLLGLIDGLPEGAAACLHALRELPVPGAIGDGWDMVVAFDRLLGLAEDRLWHVFREAGAVDFTAIAQHALAALGLDAAPTDLARALDYRPRHLLIDEFQDTSPGQVALAAALTRGWEEGDGRTLFVVGDPMQSIYRFRKAEVGLFLDVAREGIGKVKLEHLRLHRNNRSDPVIVDWVNSVFPHVFAREADARAGAVSYAACSTDRPPCGHAQVAMHAFRAGGHDEALDGDEAGRIIEIIDATRATRPQASIAVLVRVRRHLDDLVHAFRRLRPDLPYQAVEVAPLSERQVIQDLLSLTHAMAHRADRVHWLAILRAPWCGLLLDDLHRLAGDDHASTVWQLMQDEARIASLSDDGRRRLLHLREVLEEAFAHQGRQAPAVWIEQAWRQLGGDACLRGEADRQDAQAYFSLVRQCTRAGGIDGELLGDRIGKLYASPNPDAAARGIQLMTIHKSKGLEFDCVIVPGLGQQPRKPDRRLLLWERLELPALGSCVIPAVVPPKVGEDPDDAPADAGGTDLVYALLHRMEGERERYEAQRLLYVAVTRARQTLHLLGALKDRDGALQPAAGSLLSLLWGSPAKEAFLQAAVPAAPSAAAAGGEGSAAPAAASLIRLRSPVLAGLAARRRQRAPGPAVPASAASGHDRSDVSLAAATGTLVHRYLEMIANDGLAAWPRARCQALLPACVAWLRSQGLSALDAAGGAGRALHALDTVLASDTGRWILDRHEEAHAERPLTCRLESGAQANHIVDRSFVAQGTRWIIDYKTVQCDKPQPRAFLEAHAAQHYREQLERYAGLFAAEGLPVRTAIFYVLQNELVELDVGTGQTLAQEVSLTGQAVVDEGHGRG